jgi:predicted alpha/beta-fold hydrolase
MDYYLSSSSKQFLKHITTPTLIIHAEDDPFMNDKVIPSDDELSEQVHFELSKHGGHVGFLAGSNPFRPEFWAETRSVEFIKSLEQV